MPTSPFPCPLPAATIRQHRQLVLDTVLVRFPSLKQAPPPEIPAEALRCMLVAYDHVFFGGFFAQKAPRMQVTASTRMTRTAGVCRIVRAPFSAPRIEIRMGVDFLLRLPLAPVEANGLTFDTPLEAFLSVLEHELCHAADFLLHGKLDGHGARFQALSHGLFGHKRCTHALPTRAQTAAAEGFAPGQWVLFTYRGQAMRGQITRIGKTAGVLVPDPQGAWRDQRGTRYSKYNLPVSRLKPML